MPSGWGMPMDHGMASCRYACPLPCSCHGSVLCMRGLRMSLLLVVVGLAFACDKNSDKEKEPTAVTTPATTAPSAVQGENLPVVQYYALPG